MESLLLNKFIYSFTELYKSAISEVVSTSDFKYKRNKKFPFKKDKIEIIHYPVIEENILKLKSLKENVIIPNGINFNDLWEFCQFVKFAEKAFFYYNDPDKLFYVDSNIDDMDKRKFVIKDENNTYRLLFGLERMQSPNKEVLKIIRLSVNRNYGRKMTNEFTIVNSEIKYNDDADIYLIDNINRILYERILSTFDEIENYILTRSNYNE